MISLINIIKLVEKFKGFNFSLVSSLWWNIKSHVSKQYHPRVMAHNKSTHEITISYE